jgi:hypothetical protein
VPYGLTSPFAGTVDAIVVSLLNFPMNDLELVADAGAMPVPPSAPRPLRWPPPPG